MRTPFTQRAQEIRQETSRTRPQSAQSQGYSNHVSHLRTSLIFVAFQLDGQGCQASISYKTYFDTEEVRACCGFLCFPTCMLALNHDQDIAQHSHEIGLANLPFTRRGRKVAVQNEKERGRNKSMPASDQDQMGSASTPGGMAQSSQHGVSSFSSAVSMLAPLPGQSFPPPTPQPYGFANAIHSFPPNAPPQQQPVAQNMPHERWENMATLFQTVRDHARQFEYPPASVAALETVLIRLYLESPMGVSPHHNMANFIQHTLTMHNRNQAQAAQGSGANGSSTDGQGSSNADGNS